MGQVLSQEAKIKPRIVWLGIAACVVPLVLWGQTPAAPKAAVAPPSGRVLRFITDFDSPPFSFKEAGKKQGFGIDLGEAIGRELGARVEWIQNSFNPKVYASLLAQDKADAAICSIAITHPRKDEFSFTVPYFRSNLAVATIKNIDWDHQVFQNGLKGLTVGILRRSIGEQWARDHLKARRITYYSPTRMAQALKNKSVFCILIDEDIFHYILASNAYRFQIVERNLDHEDYGIAVKKGNDALVNELNSALKRLDVKDSYDTLYDKWFAHRADLPQEK
ncbi:MAG: ABC transporter substrate-binding protein [Candidatus Aureabacteria bacterium]|nr:ABC transporter substrate-binding protein [Candidatus Auribacterota bacterium]